MQTLLKNKNRINIFKIFFVQYLYYVLAGTEKLLNIPVNAEFRIFQECFENMNTYFQSLAIFQRNYPFSKKFLVLVRRLTLFPEIRRNEISGCDIQ